MTSLDQLLVDLGRALAFDASSPDAEGRQAPVAVERLDVQVPVETRVRGSDGLFASLPRWRLATGFTPAMGSMTARFVRSSE